MMVEIEKLFLKKVYHIHLVLLSIKKNCTGLIGKHGLFNSIFLLAIN